MQKKKERHDGISQQTLRRQAQGINWFQAISLMQRETTIARNKGFDYVQVKGKMCKPRYEPGPLTCS